MLLKAHLNSIHIPYFCLWQCSNYSLPGEDESLPPTLCFCPLAGLIFTALTYKPQHFALTRCLMINWSDFTSVTCTTAGWTMLIMFLLAPRGPVVSQIALSLLYGTRVKGRFHNHYIYTIISWIKVIEGMCWHLWPPFSAKQKLLWLLWISWESEDLTGLTTHRTVRGLWLTNEQCVR